MHFYLVEFVMINKIVVTVAESQSEVIYKSSAENVDYGLDDPP